MIPISIPMTISSLLRVEFVLKTDSGYPRDAEVTLFTLATPWSSLRFNNHHFLFGNGLHLGVPNGKAASSVSTGTRNRQSFQIGGRQNKLLQGS